MGETCSQRGESLLSIYYPPCLINLFCVYK
jgi:hypothetical protein